jgi:hypothetical protein
MEVVAMEMEKERIDEIMKDPNTWEWDGCTLPEDSENHYSEDFKKDLDDYFSQFKDNEK